ncbi:unnamed protein product [Paramecium pentaurelia]|uniref:Uncharacterized protein n=1 Tax=Paramecium pentaurelia TaxID=43138 RepID=A0A8S1SYC5_9CILI|nr:unnamed protein product [Paramecium pentaurelia]
MKSGLYEEDNLHPQNQPGFITITIRTTSDIYVNNTDIKINPQIPFCEFCRIVKQMIFSSVNNKQFLHEILFLKKFQEFRETEVRSLEQLGFRNHDILDVKLRLKGG